MPVKAPVDVLKESPVGVPVAVQVNPAAVAVDDESTMVGVYEVMAVPAVDVRLTAVMSTVLVTVQVNAVDLDRPKLSVAVRVTAQVHAVVGVPVTAPVVALIARPAGRVAPSDHVSALDAWVE